MPNSEVKCSQTRKFAELPYIILHSTCIIPPGIRFFGNTPRASWDRDLVYGREGDGCSIATAPASQRRGATPWPNAQACTRFTHTPPPPHSPPHMAICTLCTGVLRPPRTARSSAISLPAPTARASKTLTIAKAYYLYRDFTITISTMPKGDRGLPANVHTNG